MQSMLNKSASQDTAELKEDEKNWVAELNKLRGLLGSERTLKSLQDTELPALEKQVKEESEKLELAQQDVETVSSKN